MTPHLSIFVCETFAPEVKAVVEQEGYPDVSVEIFPLHCGSPIMSTMNLLEQMQTSSSHSTHLHYIGSSCFQIQKESPKLPEFVSLTPLSQCFDILIPSQLTSSLIHQRNYLVSSGWLPSFKQQIQGWGFDDTTAKLFFGETSENLLLVNTGLSNETETLLEEASRFIGIPYSTIDLGLSHCRLLIKGIVMEWRFLQERDATARQLKKITRESADYSMAFNQISLLAQLSDEKKIKERIAEMIQLLFAPARAFFIPEGSDSKNPPEELFSNSMGLAKGDCENASFAIQLIENDKNNGRIDVVCVSFPEYLGYYQKLSPILGKIFGLVLSNAGKYETIREHEKLLQISSLELTKLNATKDKFFNIIAHDLRSPFNSLLGFISLFLNDYDDFTDEEKKDFIRRIQGISKNTFRLLENLLDWARAQSGDFQVSPDSISLRQLILDNVDIFAPGASKKNIRLLAGSHQDIDIFADRYSIDAVIRNLINNALKFTNQGGEISFAFQQEGKMAICSVTDTGIGIPPLMAEQLFRIDSQVKRPGTAKESGTGLGLILCKEFVEMNGGEIWVESEEGKGSTFSFSVPLVDGP
ncbi:MAG: HAMP domain-containing histidine kinase [Bacteroidales bacterium]|nr:HAMP domain-containing histidine kinase [Bacteroidales bacterium]